MNSNYFNFHHVGCLVDDIDTAKLAFPLADSDCPTIYVSSQKVSVCMLPMGAGTFLELVRPDEDNAYLRRLLTKGHNYYHIGMTCPVLDRGVEMFVNAGSRVLNRFASEAFGGADCVFLVNTERQLVELFEPNEP